MVRLDADIIRSLSPACFRVLSALEQGHRNHALVPTSLVITITGLRPARVRLALDEARRNKLCRHETIPYESYRITCAGEDALALNALVKRGTITALGKKIGVGKESDVYEAITNEDNDHDHDDGDDDGEYDEEQQQEEGQIVVVKIHRLGKVSFRQVKNLRDYHQHRTHASWLYLATLAAKREYEYLQALYEHGFPTPRPIEHNRHMVVMDKIEGYPLEQVKTLKNPEKVYAKLMNMLVQLAQHGLIHGDFNEFNLIINEDEQVTIIDMPQMVSTTHKDAQFYFNRDAECIRTFFAKRFGLKGEVPVLAEIDKRVALDVEIAASGNNWTEEGTDELERFLLRNRMDNGDENDDSMSDLSDENELEDRLSTMLGNEATADATQNQGTLLFDHEIAELEPDIGDHLHDDEDNDDIQHTESDLLAQKNKQRRDRNHAAKNARRLKNDLRKQRKTALASSIQSA